MYAYDGQIVSCSQGVCLRIDCIDDASIYSNSWTDHMSHLREVFSSVREAGLTLKLSKCEFAQSEITFLGYKVGSNGCVPLVKDCCDSANC